ncbi:hypothetical protein SGQ83_08220 [Flavobacterium sp. Fl-318]|uniref:DUF2946 domain-containing protein n=1 Tax=Flavobacterium cupriresistens TaxID=2893885 RepID=A0ABU4R9R7_9FLAO|nr:MULTISPECIES: hypothetical protein [unclassified Flavobacterium]MDX6189327.1 hypothetical protein [Flavobacterium sp. Fl-318]UFH41422.1 hypothetical protein LNP23_16590 [Flavobacterium sp. F-323]
MKKKLKFINLLMPLIVLFAILFPVVHSYEHIHSHNLSVEKKVQEYTTNKSDFKAHNYTSEECQICHFKFSPVANFSYVHFEFYKSISNTPYVYFYFKTYSNYFKGALFALRAPPTI